MKFSVLLPTRNRLDLLKYAIETVRRQDYDNWEIIVSDNFSEEDIAGYIRSLNDPRIRYFRTDSFIPVTENWNNALEKSDGDYVIMLGDDDCLMKGYFSAVQQLVKEYSHPDAIYMDTYLFAYPGVMPSFPEGFLKLYSYSSLIGSAKKPFLLSKDQASRMLNYSLNFKVRFGYNMQFYTVSRRFIRSVEKYGKFYQSPFPDYYAANVLMLKAERILISPEPLVTVGISPKSFGFYYFNESEEKGENFLKNLPDAKMINRLEQVLLPGSNMNTSWLLAMETIKYNYRNEADLKIRYGRYRLFQIFSVYANFLLKRPKAESARNALWQKMNFSEKLLYGSFFSVMRMVFAVLSIFPEYFQIFVVKVMLGLLGAYPLFFRKLPGTYASILDVFEQVGPTDKFSNHDMNKVAQ